MAKIIDYDFRKGSIVNKGTLATTEVLTGATIQNSEKGMAMVATNVSSHCLTVTTSLSGTYTVEFAVRVDSVPTGSGYFSDFRFNSGTGYIYSAAYTGLDASSGTKYINGVVSATLAPKGQWMHIVVSGISIITTKVPINSNSNAGQGCVGKYAFYRIYEGTLTASEVAKLYTDYLNSQPIGKPKRGFLMNKPNDLSSEVNKTVGSNVLTNPTFTTWSGSNPNQTPNGWSILNTNANNYFQEGVNGGVRCLMVGSNILMYQLAKIPVGKCKIIINATVTSGVLSIEETNGGTVLGTISASGNTIIEYTATASNGIRFGRSSGTVDITINSFYIYPLSGLVAAYNMKPNGLTLTDISGNGYNGTINPPYINTLNGIKLTNQGTSYITTAMYVLGTQNFSMSFRYNALNGSSNILFRMGGGYSTAAPGISLTTAGLQFSSSARVYVNGGGTAIPTDNKTHNATIVCNRSGAISLYVDSVLFHSVDISAYSSESVTNSTTLNISQSGVQGAVIELEDFRWYNRALSLQEVKDYHNQFAKQPYIVEDFSDVPADGNAIVPREWIKTSGTFKAGEISIASGNLTSGVWENTHSTSFDTFTGASAAGFVGSSATAENARARILATMTVGKRYRMTFNATFTNCTINITGGVNYGGANTPVIAMSQGFNNMEFTLTTASTEILLALTSSGAPTLTISNFSLVEIPPLPTLTKGTKYIECVTAGNLGTSSKLAFTTWRFGFLKGADANVFEYTFVAKDLTPRASGVMGMYTIVIGSDEALYLIKDFNTYVTRTVAGYVPNNTYLEVEVRRTNAGIFTTLIRGGSFVPTAGYDGWTLVSVTGGSGANPSTAETTYTTSNYSFFNTKAGDRLFKPITINGVII